MLDQLIIGCITGILTAFFASILAYQSHQLLDHRNYLSFLISEIETNYELLMITEQNISDTINRKFSMHLWAGLDKGSYVDTGEGVYFFDNAYRNFNNRGLNIFIPNANLKRISNFYSFLRTLNIQINSCERMFNVENQINLERLIFSINNLFQQYRQSIVDEYSNIPIQSFRVSISGNDLIWLYKELIKRYPVYTIGFSLIFSCFIIFIIFSILSINQVHIFGVLFSIIIPIFSLYWIGIYSVNN